MVKYIVYSGIRPPLVQGLISTLDLLGSLSPTLEPVLLRHRACSGTLHMLQISLFFITSHKIPRALIPHSLADALSPPLSLLHKGPALTVVELGCLFHHGH